LDQAGVDQVRGVDHLIGVEEVADETVRPALVRSEHGSASLDHDAPAKALDAGRAIAGVVMLVGIGFVAC
jgi:hypothetical protein